MDINIIFEDKHILVVEKPPTIASQEDKTGDESLMSLLNRPYLGLVQRLDRPVGGVMVYATNPESNSFLSKEISNKNLRKEYLAIVCGKPENPIGELIDHLKKLKTINMSKVVEKGTKEAKEAILEYEVLDTIDTDEYGVLSLLKIKLKTGRHHQIRVQLSNAGMPIWGDNKYNKTFVKKKNWTQICLWSHTLNFKHPKTKQFVEFVSVPYDEYPWNLFAYKF